jgi:hypothetical protein
MRFLADENFPGFAVRALHRIQSPSSIVLTEKIIVAIELRTDWAEHFSTIDNIKIRMREL